MASPPPPPPVLVRQVWASNLDFEMALIKKLLPFYPIVSIDTEFPGLVFQPNVDNKLCSKISPSHNYQILKANVDALNIIQLGLSLCDAQGNLAQLGTNYCFVWEFNFNDFDIHRDLYNKDSIQLLLRQGIDFEKNRVMGIPSVEFTRQILNTGLLINLNIKSTLTWVTFHSAYDFGYLIKILTRRKLPSDINDFMKLVAFFFGPNVYDMKHMMKFCDGLYGGLERVAKALSVERVAGASHQAGSDSLLTLQTFMKFKDVYFSGKNILGRADNNLLNGFQGVLHGLEVGA